MSILCFVGFSNVDKLLWFSTFNSKCIGNNELADGFQGVPGFFPLIIYVYVRACTCVHVGSKCQLYTHISHFVEHTEPLLQNASYTRKYMISVAHSYTYTHTYVDI